MCILDFGIFMRNVNYRRRIDQTTLQSAYVPAFDFCVLYRRPLAISNLTLTMVLISAQPSLTFNFSKSGKHSLGSTFLAIRKDSTLTRGRDSSPSVIEKRSVVRRGVMKYLSLLSVLIGGSRRTSQIAQTCLKPPEASRALSRVSTWMQVKTLNARPR